MPHGSYSPDKYQNLILYMHGAVEFHPNRILPAHINKYKLCMVLSIHYSTSQLSRDDVQKDSRLELKIKILGTKLLGLYLITNSIKTLFYYQHQLQWNLC